MTTAVSDGQGSHPWELCPLAAGGSHGHLMNELVLSILQDRKPLVEIAQALDMTVCGIVAHRSAPRDGERMRVPCYSL